MLYILVLYNYNRQNFTCAYNGAISFDRIKIAAWNLHVLYIHVVYLGNQDLSTIRNAVSGCHILY
jgi:hypothetical protein